MAEILFMRRTLTGLQPGDRLSAEALERIPLGAEVRAEVTRPRNLKHHKKFFALLKAIFPHQTIYPTMTLFRGAVEVALGYGETMKLPDGRVMMIPQSISFASMDQTEFEALFDRAVELITTRILPGVDKADLSREVAEILAGRGVAA